MKKYLEVIGDENDADYITERNEITDGELMEFMPLIKAISEKRGKANWETSHYAHGPPDIMYEEFDEELLNKSNR